MSRYFKRYWNSLHNIPAPSMGIGKGCHPTLLSVANLGRIAGLSFEQITRDLQDNIPDGKRTVGTDEIEAAVAKAFDDNSYKSSKPTVAHDAAALEKILKEGEGASEADLTARSPIKIIDAEVSKHGELLLETLYAPDDILFLGKRTGWYVCERDKWLRLMRKKTTPLGPFIIPNTMTGEPVNKQDGGKSYRCDAAVKNFMLATVEFDNLTKEQQYAFWYAIKLPVVALIDTGGKSIHGWVHVPCSNAQEWEAKVEEELFRQRLVPLGVDASCSNESRLSRLPGVMRPETNNWQRLIYLSPILKGN